MSAELVLDFWFQEIEPEQRFQKNPDFDQLIKSRFLTLHEQARNCQLYSWRLSSMGSLAEIILLDQFSRNIFRDQSQAFAFDNLALALSQFVIEKQWDRKLGDQHKAFLYMPFMHSESVQIHEKAVELYSQDGLEYNLSFELRHKAIIDRFGRYPHRNEILGRQSTDEELAFLAKPGSSF